MVIQDASGREQRFRMTRGQVFDVRRQRLSPGDDSPRLLLLTCYPFDALVPGGPLRYLVELAPTEVAA